MRELKFRVWDKEQERVLLVDKLSTLEWVTWIQKAVGKGDNELMQYTGLKDKKGKEIYEGDILFIEKDLKGLSNGVTYVSRKGVVEYKDGEYYVRADDNYGLTYPFPSSYEKTGLTHWEVVGNVFENPELLNS